MDAHFYTFFAILWIYDMHIFSIYLMPEESAWNLKEEDFVHIYSAMCVILMLHVQCKYNI